MSLPPSSSSSSSSSLSPAALDGSRSSVSSFQSAPTWASDVLSTASAYQPQPQAHPAASSSSLLLDSGAFMFNTHQETPLYRSSSLHQQHQQANEFHPLAQPAYQARAVDVSSYGGRTSGQSAWFQPQQQEYDTGFQAFGAAHKSTMHPTTMHQSVDSFAPLKELQLPRVELASRSPLPTSEMEPLPVYIEATCFSFQDDAAHQVWAVMRQQMKERGIVTAEEDKYHLSCQSTIGVSCSQFDVRCYSGHYTECGAAVPAQSKSTAALWYTVEFQRYVGCCMGMMQVFRHIVRALGQQMSHLKIDSRIAADVDRATADAEPGSSACDEDLVGLDLDSLAMPSLTRAPTLMSVDLESDPSLYESLLDLITSDAQACQLAGMNSLALCLDGRHPRAGDLLAEVATKLRTGQCAEVRHVAAKLMAQAATMPCASAAVVQHCLPVVLAHLCQGTPCEGKMSLESSFASETQKHLLRSCKALSSAICSHQDADGAIASSKLRKSLLKMTQHDDAEICALARETLQALQV